MNRLRILVLGAECNPEKVSTRLVAYSQAAALAELNDVTLVIRETAEDAVRRAKAPFHDIEVVQMPGLERIFQWGLRNLFKYNYDNQALTVFRLPFQFVFEWRAWRQLKRRIVAGEFDVVLRNLPVTAVVPSIFSYFLRKGPIPFVIGPINGGLPWPSGFPQLKKQKHWFSNLRNLYRFLPFARSTYRNATAIIAASSQTYEEFSMYRDKLFFIPENGITRSVCSANPRRVSSGGKLELIFVGGLLPRKACNLAVRAAAPLLQSGSAHFTVVGDGPEQNSLEQLVKSLGVEKAVDFCGWVSHEQVLSRMRSADVFIFPSLRDFGGGVVFEALACGAVPVVVDFGGPGDIVHRNVGYKVGLTNETDIVSQIERILDGLAQDRELLDRLRQQGMSYASESLTWEAKAQQITQVLNWVLRRAVKPDLLPPKLTDTHSANTVLNGEVTCRK